MRYIELSETEIHVIRIAMEAYGAAPRVVYKGGNMDTLHDLRLRFHDLAQLKLPTP